MAQRPLSFEANKGQFDEQVKFLARSARQSVFLAADGMHLVLDNSDPKATENAVVRIQFEGGLKKSEFAGVDPLRTISNYFRQGLQITNVPNFLKVRQLDVYPGIDVIYYGNQGQLEYDFMVFPGADVASIKLKLSGHEQANISEAGDLVLSTPGGRLKLHKPIAYQEKDGVRIDVPVHYVLAGSSVRFDVAEFDRTQPLIIDPILSYSTYVTGSVNDSAGAIAVDSSGNAYITGSTSSNDFPLVGAYQTSKKGSSDAFVSKLNASGSGLVYSTFLGGKQGTTYGKGIAIDAAGMSARVLNYPGVRVEFYPGALADCHRSACG